LFYFFYNFTALTIINELLNKKIKDFSFLGTKINDSSIIQQTIIMVFSWIIAQKIVDLI
jgi:hypothetical protein